MKLKDLLATADITMGGVNDFEVTVEWPGKFDAKVFRIDEETHEDLKKNKHTKLGEVADRDVVCWAISWDFINECQKMNVEVK